MDAIDIESLKQVVEEARRASSLADPPRPLGAPVPWDYTARAAVLARRAERIADLTTGDGRLLGSVLDDPEVAAEGRRVVAVDRRARHVAAARGRLGERALLVRASPENVPFRPGSFDLILLRHRPYSARQLAPLVRPGGAALIEQIHALNWHELREYLPRAPAPVDDLEVSKKVFRRAGFELIDVRTHHRPLAFRDLEHLVRTLAGAPRIVPDFSVEEDAEALAALQAGLEDERGIVVTRSRYVLEVHRPLPLE